MLDLTDKEIIELHDVVAKATHMEGLLSPCECISFDMCVPCSVITKVVDAYIEVSDRENLG